MGGAGIEGEARSRLRELGLTETDQAKPLALLSGGQRKLVYLAACLIRRPDLLLLDEPETHLDLGARSRLERFIRAFEGAVVIVSHDRYLLDETVREIALLDQGSLSLWQGNYSTYVVEREIALRRQEVLFTSQQKEIDRLEEAIRRFKQWANEMPDSADNSRHIKQARNKQRQIDTMDKVDRPVLERRKIRLSLHESHRSGQKVIELQDLGLMFDTQTILHPARLEIRRGERVGIIGVNGAGKTVLARIIVGRLGPTTGALWMGPSVRTGYFDQSQDTMSPDSTAVDLVRLVRPMREDEAVAQLMKFLFTYEQVRQQLGKLSGGERSRLQLLLLMLGQANLLVLDEPTNHLDIESMETLETSLEEYEGTVVVISHDRYFLDRIVDRVVEVRAGVLHPRDGGYSEWLAGQAPS
jgi:ATP-binding cassette subfamily F protein 3